jgi:succinate dehydrogenase/fumarate reductase flavoprotein subunit
VQGTETELQSDAVVLTTGGFGCDYTPDGLIKRHRPDLAGVPTTNGHFATGDGMKVHDP